MTGCRPSPEPLQLHPSPGRIRARLTSSEDEVCNGGILLFSFTRLRLLAFYTSSGSSWSLGRCWRASGGDTHSWSPPASAAPQEEKQSPQHSMQISRQSADSQQASMMPQSMSQGRSQSAHSPELQQQQQMQESSEVQEPQVAQSSTMLQRVRNSQKRQERMQWTQQSAEERPESGQGGQTRLGETAPDGWMLSPRKGGNPPSGINRRDGKRGWEPGAAPGASRNTPGHAQTPREIGFGGHEMTPLSTRPAEGCQEKSLGHPGPGVPVGLKDAT